MRLPFRYVSVQAKTRIPRIPHRLAQVPEDRARTRRLEQDCYGQEDRSEDVRIDRERTGNYQLVRGLIIGDLKVAGLCCLIGKLIFFRGMKMGFVVVVVVWLI